MKITRRKAGLLAVSLLVCSTPTTADAANIFEGVRTPTAATILESEPSVRWRAMADAGTAAFWDATNAWANPALLGNARGVQFEGSASQPNDIDFNTGRLTLGHEGIGLSTMGRPIPGLGGIDQSLSVVFDPVTMGLDAKVRSWSAGLSTSQVAAAIARRARRAPPAITRWLDLALGYSEKRVEETFTTSDPLLGDTRDASHTLARDRGLLLRTGAPLGPVRLDLAYGYADINYNRPKISAAATFSPGGDPTARDWRNGVAARATWDAASVWSRLPRWTGSGVSPLVSLGWAMDFVHTTSNRGDFNGWGAELGLANVLFGRFGREELAHTWGVGVGLPIGRFGGARWDHSNRSLGDFPDEKRDGWTVWLDPLEIYDAVR